MYLKCAKKGIKGQLELDLNFVKYTIRLLFLYQGHFPFSEMQIRDRWDWKSRDDTDFDTFFGLNRDRY